MRSVILFFMCLLCPTLFARDITYYCKKALHKSESHSLSGIDYVYLINRHKDLNKFKMLKKMFQKYNITPYRYQAVESSALDYKTLFNIGFNLGHGMYPINGLLLSKSGKTISLQEFPMCREKSTYFHKQMTIWGIASNLSYLSVIFDAYKSKYDAAWVMTDVVKIKKDPNVISGYLALLNTEHPDWDILYTDIDSRERRPLVYDDVTTPIRPDMDFAPPEFYKERATTEYPTGRLGLRTGAYSFIISKRGIKKIVDFYKLNQFFIPFEIEIQIIPGIKSFVLRDEVVTD